MQTALTGSVAPAPAPAPNSTLTNVNNTIITPTPNFNSIDCCQDWSNVDNIMARYKQDRVNILALLVENPAKLAARLWTDNTMLSREKHCRCQMMSKLKVGLETEFSCPGCRALSRLTDLDTKTEMFTIQCGNFNGWNWRIYSHLIGQAFCQLGCGPSERAKQLLRVNQMYRSCCPELNDANKVDYLECDAFTQFTLVSIIWEELGNKHNFPTPYMMTSFICNEMGYLVLENNDNYYQLIKSQNVNGVLSIDKMLKLLLCN